MDINNYEIKRKKDLTEKEIVKIDQFILRESTTGEFINTFNYLNYHPEGRFCDDSIVVVDHGSGEIRGVMLAAFVEREGVISHPGTTFAGPIIDRNAKLEVIENTMELMLEYYENRYQNITIRKIPDYYTKQPFYMIDYILLRKGYSYGMSAMANIINIGEIISESDILTLFDSKKRNQVRKAVKEQQFVFKAEDGIRDDVWDNMNVTLQDKFQANTTHTLDEIKELIHCFPEHIKTYYVDTVEGEYGAFAVVFLFKNVFHTQYLDVNYKCTERYPNLFLILQLVKKARDMGYGYFSFGSSTEDNGTTLNRGLYHYKAGYGGGELLLPVYKKIKM